MSRVHIENQEKWMNLIQFARLSFAAAMLSLGCSNEIAEGGAVEEVGVASSALTNTMNRSLVITGTSVTREATRTEDPCSTTAGDEDKASASRRAAGWRSPIRLRNLGGDAKQSALPHD